MTDRGPYDRETTLAEVLGRIFRRLLCNLRGSHYYDDSCGNMERTRIYYRCRRCNYVMSVPYPVERR